jgi:hypothetical protein
MDSWIGSRIYLKIEGGARGNMRGSWDTCMQTDKKTRQYRYK